MAKAKLQLSLLPVITHKQAVRAEELDALRTEKKRIEQEIVELTPQVLKDLKGGDLRFQDDSPYERLIKVSSTHVSVNVQKLLAAGVSVKIIKACEDRVPYSYPRLIRKGEKDERKHDRKPRKR